MKRAYASLFTALIWIGGFGQHLSEAVSPLSIARQGSFAVGGTVLQHPGKYDNSRFVGFGTPVEEGQSYHADHAVVDFQIPAGAYRIPLVFVHGYGQSGRCWQTTPDGREGFQTLMLRHGFGSYVVDLPDIGSHDTQTDLAALIALFDRIGEGILVTHSAGGFPGWMAAIGNPNVRGIVSYEPGTYVFPEGEVPDPMPSLTGTLRGTGVPMNDFMKLTKIPIVLYFGDYIPEEVTDKLGGENWRAINRHGGNATLVELPGIGIRGNTHFMMSDLNNAEIADLLAGWLHDNELEK